MGKGKSINSLLKLEEEVHGIDSARESLFGLIEWAITFAASNYPVEFHFHRDSIAQKLFKNTPNEKDDGFPSMKIEDMSTVGKSIDVPLQRMATETETGSAKPRHEDTETGEIKCQAGKPRMGLDSEAEQRKLEASKRKLHQAYQQEADRKRSRKMQVIEMNQLPAPKVLSCKNAPRQRPAAAAPVRAFGCLKTQKRPPVGQMRF